MTQVELFALMEQFDRSGIEELSYRQGEESILLRKKAEATVAGGYAPAVTTATMVPAITTPSPPKPPVGRLVTAPLVGTYYASPSPDAPPFVAVGQVIKKGETMAVIEAMKMINELPAPYDCTVEEILVENGSLVGFADALLRISEMKLV